MPAAIRRYLPWAIVGVILYILLSHHFIFTGFGVPEILKKNKLTLNYTFYNIGDKKNPTIMAVDPLREDGIGKLLVEMGRMSEAEYEKLMDKYGEYEEED